MSLKVLFIPVDHFGHINPCIGIGEQLVALGHRAIIALEQSWKGKISNSYPGIEEALYIDPTRQNASSKANEYWIDAVVKGKTETFPLEGVEKVIAEDPEKASLRFYILLNVDNELKRIINEVKPDVIVFDGFVTVPAVYHSGITWVRQFSHAPLSLIPCTELPPAGSGLPLNGDRNVWNEFQEIRKSHMAPVIAKLLSKLQTEYDVPPPPYGTAHLSPYLNIYAYPEEMDYLDIRPLPDNFKRFDNFIRFTEKDPNFKIPDDFLNSNRGKLVYVSMGSMGSVDLILMQRLIDICAQSPNRFIFALGPRHEQLKLADNVWGAKFVPQVNVLPLVDLVITHGGNNTVLETLYFGKLMIVNPLFAEQPENAQRISEVGLGHRINVYTCEPQELLDKIDDLLSNEKVKNKLDKISNKFQTSNSTLNAAKAIIAVADKSKK